MSEPIDCRKSKSQCLRLEEEVFFAHKTGINLIFSPVFFPILQLVEHFIIKFPTILITHLLLQTTVATFYLLLTMSLFT